MQTVAEAQPRPLSQLLVPLERGDQERPLVVRRMVPLSPSVRQVEVRGQVTSSKLAVVPLDCADQVASGTGVLVGVLVGGLVGGAGGLVGGLVGWGRGG